VLADRVRGQDLPPAGLGHHPGGGVHGLPVQVTVALGDFANVDADTDLDGAMRIGGVVVVQRALDGYGGTDGCHRGREGDKESVAQRLVHSATKCHDLLVHNRCLQAQDVVGLPITSRAPQNG
jgi:hypothetical protein